MHKGVMKCTQNFKTDECIEEHLDAYMQIHSAIIVASEASLFCQTDRIPIFNNI